MKSTKEEKKETCHAYNNVLTFGCCTEGYIKAKALCNKNKQSVDPRRLLTNKAVYPENNNEPLAEALNHIRRIKAVSQRL